MKTIRPATNRKALSEWIRVSKEELERTNLMLSTVNAEPIDEMWKWLQPQMIFVIQIHALGTRCFGATTHLTVKKIDVLEAARNKTKALILSEEPTYSEKVKIVSKLINRSDIIAMEVLPNEENLVDQANLYHIWVAEKSQFPFSIIDTTTLPEGKEWESEIVDGLDIEFMVHTKRYEKGKAAYLYVRRKDGKELCWREKQKLKNELQYEGITAVEIISKHGINKPTCLLCLSLGFTLDFGLHTR